MTTDRQRRANAGNARKSTGPKTARGQAVSSGNARKHGLTSAPPWDNVTRFYRIILNDAAARPDPLCLDDRARAALALAEAEAQLARCVTEERKHLVRMAERAGDGAHAPLEEVIRKVTEKTFDLDVMEAMLENDFDAGTQKMLRFLIRQAPDRPAELHRRIKTLRRYRREAEARRRKALRHWCEVAGAQGEPSRMEVEA